MMNKLKRMKAKLAKNPIPKYVYKIMTATTIWNGNLARRGSYSLKYTSFLASTDMKLMMSPFLYFLLVALESFRVFS